MKRIGVVLILLFAFGGLADSAYLAEHELSGAPLICNLGSLSGCNIVAQSSYSYLFGIPLAEYGILFYGALFALAALELVVFDRALRRALQGFALVGILFSVYATLLQIFVIHAFCIYCLASAVMTALIFALACFIEPMSRLRAAPAPLPEAHARPPFSMPPGP